MIINNNIFFNFFIIYKKSNESGESNKISQASPNFGTTSSKMTLRRGCGVRERKP